ncbi:MAG: hypothetical protein NDI84_06905 [Steroidobacteraceae bacterium]|nr:hypothetical protein [Steroidobacteraceae bacterium]
MPHATATSFAILGTALLSLVTSPAAQAQSTFDEQQVFLARIQTNERAIVLESLDLDDTQVAAFTPLYDDFQAQYKKVMDRAIALLETFAANCDSMTDDAAERLLADWFDLKSDEDRLIKEYARRMGKVLPPSKVLRFVQIENKLSTVLRLEALQGVPLAK